MRLKIVYFFLVVSLIGFTDATYLTVQHFRGESPSCSVIVGCGEVTSSAYATVGVVPVALLGALYYLAVVLLSVFYIDTKKEILLKHLSFLTVAGLVASIYFVVLQLFVIKYICIYCMVSAATSTLLFVGGMWHLKKLKKIVT